MSRMRVAQVSHPTGPLELVEREIPEAGAGSVRIKVQACGICHSDFFTKEGMMGRMKIASRLAYSPASDSECMFQVVISGSFFQNSIIGQSDRILWPRRQGRFSIRQV